MDGTEAVQLYVTFLNEGKELPLALTPIRALEGVDRVWIRNKETKVVEFVLDAVNFALVDKNGEKKVFAGKYEISVGGGQKGYAATVEKTVEIVGETTRLESCTATPYYCPDMSDW